jgi:hypothetical protein
MLSLAGASAAQADSTSPAKRAGGLVVLKATKARVAKTGCSPALLAFACPFTVAALLSHLILAGATPIPQFVPGFHSRFQRPLA